MHNILHLSHILVTSFTDWIGSYTKLLYYRTDTYSPSLLQSRKRNGRPPWITHGRILVQCTSKNKHKCNVSHLIFIVLIFSYGLVLESQNKIHLGIQANWGKKKKKKKNQTMFEKKKKTATNSSNKITQSVWTAGLRKRETGFYVSDV